MPTCLLENLRFNCFDECASGPRDFQAAKWQVQIRQFHEKLPNIQELQHNNGFPDVIQQLRYHFTYSISSMAFFNPLPVTQCHPKMPDLAQVTAPTWVPWLGYSGRGVVAAVWQPPALGVARPRPAQRNFHRIEFETS